MGIIAKTRLLKYLSIIYLQKMNHEYLADNKIIFLRIIQGFLPFDKKRFTIYREYYQFYLMETP